MREAGTLASQISDMPGMQEEKRRIIREGLAYLHYLRYRVLFKKKYHL